MNENEFEDIDLNDPKDKAINSSYPRFNKIDGSILDYKGRGDLQKLVGVVLEQTSEFYVESKEAGKNEIKKILQEELITLMEERVKNKIHNVLELNNFVQEFKNNIDSYVDALDKEALKSQNKFAQVGRSLQKGENPGAKDSSWKIVADLCRKVKCTGLAEYFDKRNEEVKFKATQKSVEKIEKTLRDKGVFSNRDVGRSNVTPSRPGSESKSKSRS